MWVRRLLVATAFLVSPLPALCAEALGLKVLGFSPGGRHFGFIQYGGVGDGGEYVAEAHVVEIERGRPAPRFPLRVESTQEETPHTDPRPYDEWLLEYAKAQFARGLSRYKFHLPAPPVATDAVARASETFPISSDVALSLGARSIDFVHGSLGPVWLHLQEKRLPWPRRSRAGSDAGAISCAEEVDWEQGAAFRLTLRYGKQTIVLNDDTTIPASRHCVLGYGIAEAHAYSRPDGKVSLAVIVCMAVLGFEGSDRRFLAVTAVLSP